MKHAAVSTSVRLPAGADEILNRLVESMHTTRAKFIRDAIIEKIEDALDIKSIEEVLARKEKTYSMEQVKRELGLED